MPRARSRRLHYWRCARYGMPAWLLQVSRDRLCAKHCRTQVKSPHNRRYNTHTQLPPATSYLPPPRGTASGRLIWWCGLLARPPAAGPVIGISASAVLGPLLDVVSCCLPCLLLPACSVPCACLPCLSCLAPTLNSALHLPELRL